MIVQRELSLVVTPPSSDELLLAREVANRSVS